MNKKDKLLQRFKNLPRNFTFEEMESLFKKELWLYSKYAMKQVYTYLDANEYLKNKED